MHTYKLEFDNFLRLSPLCGTCCFTQQKTLPHIRTILLLQVKGEFSALQLKSAVKVVVVVSLYHTPLKDSFGALLLFRALFGCPTAKQEVVCDCAKICLLSMQVRPLLDSEKAKGAAACMDAPSTTVVQLPPRRDTSEPYRFDFDRVYKMSNPGGQAWFLARS